MLLRAKKYIILYIYCTHSYFAGLRIHVLVLILSPKEPFINRIMSEEQVLEIGLGEKIFRTYKCYRSSFDLFNV